MTQPLSIVNTRGADLDVIVDSAGVIRLKLGIGTKTVAGLSNAAMWQGVATHMDGAAFAASDGMVVAGGYETATGFARKFLTDANGRQFVNLAESTPLTWGMTDAQTSASIAALSVNAQGALFNGVTTDKERGNVNLTLLASAARTATTNSGDQVNYNGRGLHVIVDVTVAGTGSITITIQGKDPVSGQYYTILAGAAITTISTNIYKVYPGLPATANVSANDILPRTWRVLVTANNANTITYSVGASMIL